jgi:SAM-dependent methyltransferase
VTDPREVERDLATYYDVEAADRSGRELDAERVARRDAFLQLLRPGCRLLEVGTGPGRDAGAFAAAGVTVVGVDLSIEHARLATSAGAHVPVGSVRHLPFAGGAFDAVWTMSTLMHVPSVAIAGALDEVRRVLRVGGLLAAGVWGGQDVEDHLDGGAFGPPRLFSRRADTTWQALLERVGRVEDFRTWGEDGRPFWYQYAVVRR